MKKILITMMTVMLVCVAVTPASAEWTETQVKSHTIATMARSMGLADDNPIIAEASRIWWEEQTRVNNEAMEKAEFEASLQGFLNDHYAEAVAMAGVMYAEARGLDKREMSMVAWCILNRYDTQRFGSTMSQVIWAKSQFAHSNRTVSDDGTDLIWLAQDVLSRWYRERHGEENVGRTLPKGFCYYYGNGKHNLFRTKNGGAGSYDFGLGNPYEQKA